MPTLIGVPSDQMQDTDTHMKPCMWALTALATNKKSTFP
jgi:hypothetical protein